MTFDDFQASGRDCNDIGAAIDDDILAGVKGRLYGDAPLYMQLCDDGGWFVPMMGDDYSGTDLREAEWELHQFALHEGFFS